MIARSMWKQVSAFTCSSDFKYTRALSEPKLATQSAAITENVSFKTDFVFVVKSSSDFISRVVRGELYYLH